MLKQAVVDELVAEERLIIVCGHYEGVDERIREHLVDDEMSIGDYVLSGGESAALVVIDAVVRRLPGTLGGADSLLEESHSDGLLEYPQYTRPAEFRGWQVPDILLSGNHGEIARWRRRQRILRTAKRRPDLLEKATLKRTQGERVSLTKTAKLPSRTLADRYRTRKNMEVATAIQLSGEPEHGRLSGRGPRPGQRQGGRGRPRAHPGLRGRRHPRPQGRPCLDLHRAQDLSGIGVERTFLRHSPRVDKVEVVRQGKVRRARLYYLRELRGRAARIKERARDRA